LCAKTEVGKRPHAIKGFDSLPDEQVTTLSHSLDFGG